MGPIGKFWHVPSIVPTEQWQGGELLAWRVWRLIRGDDGGLRLVSAFRETIWHGPVLTADHKPIPVAHCGSGIYALKPATRPTPGGFDWAMGAETWVRGWVALSGQVVEHQLGYRAERAVIRRLRLGAAAHRVFQTPAALVAAQLDLERRYQCPVKITGIDARIARGFVSPVSVSGARARLEVAVSAAAAALRALALGDTPDARKRGWISLHALSNASTGDPEQRLTTVLEEAWHGVRINRAAMVQALARVVQTDPSLLTIEFAAWALVLEEEDGVTELLSLARHPDFGIRSKVAIGFERLGRGARWAVPALIRHLENEPVDYVARCLLRTLGRIGGRESVRALEHIEATNWELAETAREALAESRRLGECP